MHVTDSGSESLAAPVSGGKIIERVAFSTNVLPPEIWHRLRTSVITPRRIRRVEKVELCYDIDTDRTKSKIKNIFRFKVANIPPAADLPQSYPATAPFLRSS